jgi:hypothetical protein
MLTCVGRGSKLQIHSWKHAKGLSNAAWTHGKQDLFAALQQDHALAPQGAALTESHASDKAVDEAMDYTSWPPPHATYES